MNPPHQTNNKWFSRVLTILYFIDAFAIVAVFHLPIITISIPMWMSLITDWIYRYGKDNPKIIRIGIPLLLFLLTVFSQALMVVY